MSWEDWYDALQVIAGDIGVSVADVDAWKECYDDEMSPHDALAEEYPEEMEGYV